MYFAVRFLENKPLPARQTNLDVCVKKLQVFGSVTYEVRTFLANSQWYGVPQNRSRYYILAFRSDEIGAETAKSWLDKTLLHLKQINLETAPVVTWIKHSQCCQCHFLGSCWETEHFLLWVFELCFAFCTLSPGFLSVGQWRWCRWGCVWQDEWAALDQWS